MGDKDPRKLPWLRFAIGTACLTLAFAIASYSVFQLQQRVAENAAVKALAIIADLKASQISAWHSKRMAALESLSSDSFRMQTWANALGGRASAQDLIAARKLLEDLGRKAGFSAIMLSDLSGGSVVSAGTVGLRGGGLAGLVARARTSERSIVEEFGDSETDAAGPFAFALLLKSARARGAFGVLIAQEDAGESLPSTLQAWPLRSVGGQTILWDPLKHRALGANGLERRGAAVKALTTVKWTGARPASGAQELRDNGILAVRRPVAATPWFLVAAIGREDVLAPDRASTLATAVSSGALLVAAFVSVYVLLRRREHHYAKKIHEARVGGLAVRGHYDYLSRYANDIILLFDETGRIVEANDRAVRAYGRSREELLRRNIRDLRDESSLDDLSGQWNALENYESFLFETVHVSGGGRRFPVEVSSRLIVVEGRRFRQSIIRDISERKVLEGEMRATLARLSAVIAASPAAIIVLSVDSLVTGWNKAAETIFGWTEQEILGKPLPIIPGHLRFEAQRLRERVTRGDSVAGLEYELQTKCGETIDVSFFAAAFRDEAKRPVGFVGVLLDITEQKRIVRELAASESRFRALFEQAAVGVAMLSTRGRLLRVNERFGTVIGRAADTVAGLSILDILPLEESESREELRTKLFSNLTRTYSGERRFLRADGSDGWIALTISELKEPAGEPRGFVAVLEDVTDRKMAQEASARDSARLSQMIDHAPQGILVHSGKHISRVNPAAVQLFGAHSADELIGSLLVDRVHPDERQDVLARYDALMSRTVTVPAVQRRYLRMDGSILDTEASAAAIDFDNQPAALVFFRDISDRKRAEAEKTHLEEQLLQSQKLESIGLLAGGIAHDFNNHLTVINGYCDLLTLRMTPEDSSFRAICEIRHAGERAAAMTRQLLAFSRKQVIEARPIRLSDVVEDVRSLLQPLLGEGIQLSVRAQEEPATVTADAGQLTQVLMNLAVNARDAMPSGGSLTIETSNFEIGPHNLAQHSDIQPGLYALLSVTDTGIGMSEATQRRIFEPFFTTKDKGKGTGLGLSMVYGIVHQMGGWVGVKSELGKGATFSMYFPRVDRSAEPVARPEAIEHGRIGSETLLLVEDQQELLALSVQVLSECGYKIIAAESGADALLKSAAHPGSIALMVTDVVMPEMSGRELAAHMKALRPEMRVLYTSGYTADAIVRDGVLETSLDYLPKPFSPMELVARVRAALDA